MAHAPCGEQDRVDREASTVGGQPLVQYEARLGFESSAKQGSYSQQAARTIIVFS